MLWPGLGCRASAALGSLCVIWAQACGSDTCPNVQGLMRSWKEILWHLLVCILYSFDSGSYHICSLVTNHNPFDSVSWVLGPEMCHHTQTSHTLKGFQRILQTVPCCLRGLGSRIPSILKSKSLTYKGTIIESCTQPMYVLSCALNRLWITCSTDYHVQAM